MRHLGALFFCVLVALPSTALAHASGTSFEQVIGPYRADIGYDPDALVAGAAQVFDFALFNAATDEQVPVEEIWVRIVEGERTLFASGLRESDFGRTTLLYVFAKEGAHTVAVSFRAKGTTLAELELPLSVEASQGTGLSFDAISAALGALGALGAGALGALLVWRRRRRVL